MPKIQALIDGDIVAFRSGFSCESWVLDEHGEKQKAVLPIEIAYARTHTMLEKLLAEVGTDNYKIFLTDSNGNFRKTVCADYKANRKDVPRPIHLKALETFLERSWGAERAVGCEADDLMGICQTTNKELGIDSVICTIDKDLDTITGKHYNFVKCEWHDVDEDEAQFFFYKQLLMGDTTDNITGVPGIGPKKAEKALQPYFGNELEMYRVVYGMYQEAYPNLVSCELEDIITTVGRLVYIRHSPEEMWSPPI